MSRLIVKNVPAYLSDTRLREHFSSQPSSSKSPSYTITDVRLARKPDGSSRKFAFVGYKTEDEARRAKEYFNRTYLDSTRITVEVVEETHEPPPRKRQRVSAPDEEPRVAEPKRLSAKSTKDDQKVEFLDVMQRRSKDSRSWADAVHPADTVVDGAEQQAKKGTKRKRAGPETTQAGQLQGDVPGENETAPEGVSDLEWMKQRMKRGLGEPDKPFSQSDDEEDAIPPAADSSKVEPQPTDEDATRDTILSTGRLFLRNLAYSCTAKELEDAFSPYGGIAQVHIPLSASKTPSGLAFVTFSNPPEALAAYTALNGSTFQGRQLHILAAVDKRPRTDDGKAKGVKEKKEEQRKKTSGRGFDWGMLYMNSDAVASSVAERMGVDKAEILNGEDGNAAVNLALAETQVIQETKSYLESNGVNLEALSGHVRRSATTILVKNLPAFTTVAQIQELFSPHGELARVLVPPSGTMAVVEFTNESDAGVAWRAVSYRRLGNSIIYLEKGPIGMWTTDPKGAPAPVGQPSAAGPKPVALPVEKEPDEAEPGSTLFIKNLAFSTTTDVLTSVFRTLPGFVYARVQTKPSPKDPSGVTRLSMGYGFAGFKTKEEAERARTAMDGVECEGHRLSVRFAGRGKEDEEKGEKSAIGLGNKKTTKMIVKNVPFEATKNDIRQLFSAHGQLKSCRLPTKFDRRTRGFAFLEFVSRREAESAMAALKHTHLLGRHLVLEWAEEEGGAKEMERIREKTKVAYGDGAALPGRRKKLQLGEEAQEEE